MKRALCLSLTMVTASVMLIGVTPLAGQRTGTVSAAALFTDVTRAAGIDVTNVNGASPDKHLVETMGS